MVGPLRTRPARLPETGRRHRRGRWTLPLLPLLTVLALLASGCQGGPGDDDTPRAPLTLVVSDTWVRSHGGSGTGGASGAGEAQARIRSLQEAVDRLRRETRSGWVGRQDDVTGYLGELSGGTWPGTSEGFMDEYGPVLFGVDSSTLRFGDVDTTTIPGATTTRATQALGEVPVLDGSLVFSGRGSGAATDSLRVTAVRGRVYPDLTVGTTPTLTPEQASAAAAAAASGSADGEPRLVVLPRGAGVLAWEVVVVGDGEEFSTGLYYVDATTGALVDSRPGSGDVAAPVPAAASYAGPVAPDPGSVEVTGSDPLGRERTAYGLQSGDRVELTDTTTPAWDSASRTGAVQTFDATGLTSPGSLPGELVRSRSTTIRDPEAIAAQSFSNTIVSYFEALGRDSWDDQGGSLISSVHFGGEGYCNASFISGLRQPQMVYGDACVLNGEQQTGSFVEPDIAAHEITHGVTATSAGLLYTGQSGALNESFSDYFGNIIGDRIRGSDSSALGEDSCSVVPAATRFCVDNPDGTRSFRTMLNGNDFDDYLRILDPGRRLTLLLNYKQDYGGVHYNSAIWNNALWTIRSRLAQIDGEDMRTSPLAASFDQAVYGALATRLTPNSGFVDARAAVEQVVVDSSLDPVVLRVAREVFDQTKICTGCPDTGDLAGDPVNTSPQTQLHPTVSGDQVVWLDLSAGTEFAGYAGAASLDGGSGAPRLTGAGEALEVTFAGDAVVALDYNGRVVAYEAGSNAPLPLDDVDIAATLAAGLVGGADGAAWLGADGESVTFLDPEGEVTPLAVPGLQGDTITSIGVGGGSVAAGTDQGKVFVGTVESGTLTQVGQVDGAVISSATSAGNVFVIADDATSTLITADGTSAPVTDRAAPFGASMSGDYVVWAEAVGGMQAGVGPGGQSPYPDTDLYLLSLATGQIYDLHPAPAQQGFPSLDGDRLVWQDATFGGDDVFTATVPEGL